MLGERDSSMKSEFIYLDWNVVKALKENRAPQSFVNAIMSLKSQYRIPFSFAHLCDRQKNLSAETKERVKDDLEFFGCLSDGYMFGKNGENYGIAKQDIFQKYDEVTVNKLTRFPAPHIPSEILQQIKDVGFQKFFENKQNIEWYMAIMFCALSRFECDPELYKLYREVFSIRPPCELSFFADLQKTNITPEVLKKATDAFLEFNGENKNGVHSKLGTAYLLLDFCPGYREGKINQKNNFTNIYTDSEHTVNASFAKYYITEDHFVRKKAGLVYLAYGIKTQVFSIDEFVKAFQQ